MSGSRSRADTALLIAIAGYDPQLTKTSQYVRSGRDCRADVGVFPRRIRRPWVELLLRPASEFNPCRCVVAGSFAPSNVSIDVGSDERLGELKAHEQMT